MDFPETHWSQLVALRPDAPDRRARLEALLARYWGPVRAYVRALRRRSADDAEDLTQAFFATLLERDGFARLAPERGSFRGFLKTSVKNFVVSAERAAAVRPRLAGDEGAALDRQADPALPPDEAFDRAWARAVLEQGLERLREALSSEGRQQALAMFEAYCLTDEAPPTYRALGERFGASEDDVRNRLREVRQRLRTIVRCIVRDQLAPGESIDDELAVVLGKGGL